MISFKMKIVKYNPTGSYLVEYLPDNERCTPVKLDINIDSSIHNSEQVLDLLKNSAPQDFWQSQLARSTIDRNTLEQLVNTTHIVNNVLPTVQTNVVTGFSSNEQLAPRDAQEIVKLKVLIQHVIKEMADGTV